MLFPKKLKFKKYHRGNLKGKFLKKISLSENSRGLQAKECGKITSRQLEAIRKILVKVTKRLGKIIFHIFPDVPITERAEESRMGSGKGNVSFWVAKIKPNMLLVELRNIPENLSLMALKMIQYKLPLKSNILKTN